MNIREELSKRELPALLCREEMKKRLLDGEYGYLPEVPYTVSVSEPKVERRMAAGDAEVTGVAMTVRSEFGEHTFPVHRLLHTDGVVRPFFVYIDIYSQIPSYYYPVEEIADNGFDVLSVSFKDISSDDGDFENGLAAVLMPNGRSHDKTGGKFMLWAFALSRILDYAETIPCLNMGQAAVLGHSRLGKTALLTGMLDERFRYVFSNDSGCSGASLSRGNSGMTGEPGEYGRTGETIAVITRVFPYWFAPRYVGFADTNAPEGFDQHFLLACIAPRFVYVASADMDDWADPRSEFLACAAASPAWEERGLPGLVHNGDFPAANSPLQAGRIGYHKRHGVHYLSRHDWKYYMDFIRLHQNDVL